MTAAETKQNGRISPTMLVSEINQKYPHCLPVFEKYGIADCGGAHSIAQTACACGRKDVDAIVADLNHSAAGGCSP